MPYTSRRRALKAAAAAAGLLALAACGGDGDAAYPDDTITLIVPYDPGGSGDIVAREWASLMSDELGVDITVQNNSGGSGTIGTAEFLDAEPDGYTLGYGHNSPLALQIHVNNDLPYSGPEDYTPIAMIGSQPSSISVHADAPWDTWEEFVEAAEQQPGEHTIAVGGAGNVKDLQMRSVQKALGVEFNITPFSGGGSEAVTAVLGGQAESVAVNPSSVAGFIEAGELRPLAIFSNGEFNGFDVDSYSDEDIPDMALLQDTSGIVGPADLPAEVSATLLEAHESVMQEESLLALLEEGGYVHTGITGDDLGKQLEADSEAFRDVLND